MASRSNHAHELFPQPGERPETGERPRALSQFPAGRDWTSLLGSLPHAIESCADAAHILPAVAQCVVPTVADGFMVDRLEGSLVRQEHVHHSSRSIAKALYSARAPRPVDDGGLVADVLRGERSAIAEDGHAIVVAVPSPEVRRAATFLSEGTFTRSDLTQAEVLAQWLSLAFSMRASEPQVPVHGGIAAAMHDLINPLTVIATNARGLREAGDLETRLAMIERAAQRMHRIAIDMLDQVRGATERISIELSWTYTGDLLEEAAAAVHDAACARAITLEVQDGDGLVVCDRSRIVQVLINLLENAIKFTPRGGRVTLAAATVDDRVRIRVSDNGRGIPPADLARLFDRYWRSSGGTGIGLATAHALVAAHDSELKVTSTVGSGSTFWFDLHAAD